MEDLPSYPVFSLVVVEFAGKKSRLGEIERIGRWLQQMAEVHSDDAAYLEEVLGLGGLGRSFAMDGGRARAVAERLDGLWRAGDHSANVLLLRRFLWRSAATGRELARSVVYGANDWNLPQIAMSSRSLLELATLLHEIRKRMTVFPIGSPQAFEVFRIALYGLDDGASVRTRLAELHRDRLNSRVKIDLDIVHAYGLLSDILHVGRNSESYLVGREPGKAFVQRAELRFMLDVSRAALTLVEQEWTHARQASYAYTG